MTLHRDEAWKIATSQDADKSRNSETIAATQATVARAMGSLLLHYGHCSSTISEHRCCSHITSAVFNALQKSTQQKKENRFRIARPPPNPENTSRNMMWRRHKLSRQSLATAAILACGNKLALKAEQMFWSSATAAQEIACRMLIAHKGNIQAARLGQL